MAIGGKRFCFLGSLLQQRYNVHVVTLDERCYLQRDFSLPVAVSVHAAPALPVYPPKKNPRSFFGIAFSYLWIRCFCIFDPFIGWLLPGFLRGLAVIKKHNIDMIIATGPPFCTMVIAWLLSAVTKKPFILDYRDPWAGYAKGLDVKPFGKHINTRLERRAVRDAAAIVVVTPAMRELLMRAFPREAAGKCEVITNGFSVSEETAPLPLEDGRKVILYAGTFYGQRRIGLLLEPLTHLIQRGELACDAFRFHVFGDLVPEDRAAIAAAGLTRQVVEHRFVEYAALVRYMKGADLLFLPSGTDVPFAIPGKFYDYLSAQRPVLAVGLPGSALENIVRETDCGEFAAIEDPGAIAEGIKKILSGSACYSFAGAANYTWDNIAAQYDRLIQAVLTHRQDLPACHRGKESHQ